MAGEVMGPCPVNPFTSGSFVWVPVLCIPADGVSFWLTILLAFVSSHTPFHHCWLAPFLKRRLSCTINGRYGCIS